MASIGGEKLTKERIHATGVFSAKLVIEAVLPLADYFRNTNGHSTDTITQRRPVGERHLMYL
ncbi:MAG: hypothetical protein QM392_03695 [Bacillota bacterium]|jgi:hypothetical protein|nr:hypothetical protein [Bacillota bacterium]